MKTWRVFIFATYLAICFAGCKHFISNKPPLAPYTPVTLSLNISPPSVFPGEPVTATATADNLDPSLHAEYAWSGAGSQGNGPTATISTAALAPGSYTVRVAVKAGSNPEQSAETSATFVVKPFEPPTISCSASPGTIKPGESATVSAVSVSPQNWPLKYSFSASGGSINGSGATATYSALGAPPGMVIIDCSVTDSQGNSATNKTSVYIQAPYVPMAPHSRLLGSISFDRDKQRPTRVDNEAAALLEEFSLDMQQQPDAMLVVVGFASAAEKAREALARNSARLSPHLRVVDFAAQRAVNIKDYLVNQKHIDAARIEVRTNTEDGQKAEMYLVPTGGSFAQDVPGSGPVDESVVRPEPRVPFLEFLPGATKTFSGTIANQGNQNPNTNLRANCTAFAIFGYPETINLDELGPSGVIKQSFQLIVGKFNPSTGIEKDTVASELCQSAGFPENNANCILDNDWEKISGCTSQSTASFQAFDKKTKYNYTVWPIKNELPHTLNRPVLQPPEWANDPSNVIQNPCSINTAKYCSWTWRTSTKNPDFPTDGDNSVKILNADYISRGQIKIPLNPGHFDPWYEEAWNWFIESFKKYLPDWIFGSSGILVAIVLYIVHKKWGKKEPPVAAPVPQLPAQPPAVYNIFINSPAENQQQNQANPGLPPGGHPTHRRLPGHRNNG